MGVLFPILATFVLLSAGMGLFALRRESDRNKRLRRVTAAAGQGPRALPPAMGAGLQELLEASVGLRHELEATRMHARQVAVLDDTLSGSRRRPLWHRLEQDSYEQDVDRTLVGLQRWLDRFDQLAPEDDRVVRQELGLSPQPVRALLDEGPDGFDPVGPAGLGALEQAIASLQRLERELAAHRPRAYR